MLGMRKALANGLFLWECPAGAVSDDRMKCALSGEIVLVVGEQQRTPDEYRVIWNGKSWWTTKKWLEKDTIPV